MSLRDFPIPMRAAGFEAELEITTLEVQSVNTSSEEPRVD